MMYEGRNAKYTETIWVIQPLWLHLLSDLYDIIYIITSRKMDQLRSDLWLLVISIDDSKDIEANLSLSTFT